MYAKFFALIVFLFLVPQSLLAKVHTVARNVATVVNLHDNDELQLVNHPKDWFFSRIIIGVNSVPTLQLSGSLVTNDCIHDLHGYYDEVAFTYTGKDKIVYHGPSQNLPIQWWADASPVVPSCRSYAKMTKRDSVIAMLYNYADSIYSEKIKDYVDLGNLNTESYYEGTSAKFKIVNLPDWFYNRILVLVEPMDGRELDGSAFAGGLRAELKGFSAKFAINQKTAFAPFFELAFSEYRKIKVKWWAEAGVPTEYKIKTKEKALSSDSVEVEYSFGDGLIGEKIIKLVYDKRLFRDGKVPVIKKFSFDPMGPDKSKTIGKQGAVYQVQATLNSNDSVTIAIPLEGYQSGKDSVLIEYFNEKENRWVGQSVDSVVDGNVYFKPQRIGMLSCYKSILFPTSITDPIEVWTDTEPIAFSCTFFSDVCGKMKDGLIYGNSIIENGFHQGVMWTIEKLRDLACPDINTFWKIFESSSDPEWDPVQGNIAVETIIQDRLKSIITRISSKRSLESLQKLSDPYGDGCDTEMEKCKWDRTRDNLDRLLADAVVTKFYGIPGYTVGHFRYKFKYNDGDAYFYDSFHPSDTLKFNDYFMTRSGLVEDAARFVQGVQDCYGAVNGTGRLIQKYLNYFGIGMSNFQFATSPCNAVVGLATEGLENAAHGLDCANFMKSDMSILQGHEGKLIAVSEAMVRISLLAWLNKSNEFRNYTLLRYKVAYDGIRAWLELAGPLLDYNNIAIKSYASLALFEYIHYGTDENLKMLNGSLNRHYGENGGFSEGTGYSQYVWDDVPYILAALKDAYKSQDDSFEISEDFLKSPDYMFDFSRPVGAVGGDGKFKHYGFIPVEVDDGVTYNPDYRVWAKLKNDPKYLAIAEKYPVEYEKGNSPLLAFGYPDVSLYNSNEKKLPDRGTLWSDFKDGVGMITAVNDDDTVSLSMIAESDNLWTRGQAHDQQDNLSITLTSSKKGFLIQDPGYSSFNMRSATDNFHHYENHNVLTTGYNTSRHLGQDDNRMIPFSELWTRTYDFSNDFTGIEATLLMGGFEMFSNFSYNYSVEGGDPAFLKNTIDDSLNGVLGFTATTKINKTSGVDKYDNNRTIMHFGGNFWVIDRPVAPEDDKMTWKWWANSPKENWDYIGVNLYGSWDGKLAPKGKKDFVKQNGGRGDYVANEDGGPDSAAVGVKNWLQNYRYSAFDSKTKTYVMAYSLGNETFDKDVAYCPILSYQCFVNRAKNMRVVVPPAGTTFRLCDVLPTEECSGNVYSNGITMLAKTLYGEWTTRWVLDGELYAIDNGVGFPIVSATVSRSHYIYEKPDGSVVNGDFSKNYLPALPILLLR